MRQLKTMLDEFALVFLAGLTQSELMSQQVQVAQGSIAIKTKSVEELVQVAYNAADAAMKVRDALEERRRGEVPPSMRIAEDQFY